MAYTSSDPTDTVQLPPWWRRRVSPWALFFIVVGGVLQGIGANIDRNMENPSRWAAIGAVAGGATSVWFARRLDWWLLLYIPALAFAMAPFAEISRIYTAGLVETAFRETGDCRGWDDLNERLAPISASAQTYANELNSEANPDLDDARRWSTLAAQVRREFEALDHPPILDEYVDLSIRVFRNYEEGFGAMANGDNERGLSLLDEADRLKSQAQAEFRTANAACTR